MRKRDPMKGVLLLSAVLAACGLGLFLVRAEAPPEGPQEVVWGKQACGHCRMHVSEPAFAAQLHTTDGDVLHFDDPGCLFELVQADAPKIHALWFHHVREDRWVKGDAAGFVEIDPTPMGFGVGAVDAKEPGAMTLDAAMKKTTAVRSADGSRR